MSKDHKPRIHNLDKNKDLRKDLRNNSTPAEKKIWNYLKNSNIENLKFRRQHGIGNYIVDFYCAEKKLVLEIDGDSHFKDDEALKYDIKRTAFLESEGLKVLRFTNTDVYKNISGVIEVIMSEIGLK